MNPDTIREFVRRQPFQPFVIRMSNGESHEVRHPECVIVLKTKIVVGYPEDERTIHCSLIHVNSVEALQPA